MNLSDAQLAVLVKARDLMVIRNLDAARSGGDEKTLASLTADGLLEKLTHRDRDLWRITEQGRAAISDGAPK